VLASASRSLLAAGPERSSLAAAAAKARDEIGAALEAGPGVPVG
jgi:hypothetical protein